MIHCMKNYITMQINSDMDFPQFSGHASITPQEEKYDAGDDHGEENSAVQH